MEVYNVLNLNILRFYVMRQNVGVSGISLAYIKAGGNRLHGNEVLSYCK